MRQETAFSEHFLCLLLSFSNIIKLVMLSCDLRMEFQSHDKKDISMTTEQLHPRDVLKKQNCISFKTAVSEAKNF